jgi:hypothetical protein
MGMELIGNDEIPFTAVQLLQVITPPPKLWPAVSVPDASMYQ